MRSFFGGLVAANVMCLALWGCGSSVVPETSGTGGGSGATGSVTGAGGASSSGNTTSANTTTTNGTTAGSTGTTMPDWTACSQPGTCVLRSRSCCGPCEPAAISAYTAVQMEFVDEYVAALGCDGIACGPCPEPTSYTSQNFAAVCEEGHCVAIDVREDDLSACSSDADCRLRWGTDCCECGGGNQNELIAVTTTQSFDAAICSEGGCLLDCAPPPYPQDALALCGGDGHCGVAFLDAPQ